MKGCIPVGADSRNPVLEQKEFEFLHVLPSLPFSSYAHEEESDGVMFKFFEGFPAFQDSSLSYYSLCSWAILVQT